jgi:hypothetical protein
LLAACAQPPISAPAFGVLGDAPYTKAEVERLEAVIEEINARPLAFVVHVGDIGSSALACTDEWLLERKARATTSGATAATR